MRRLSLKVSDRGYGPMMMAWLSHPKIRTIARQRAAHWVVNDTINLFFKSAQKGRTREATGRWYFYFWNFKWPDARYYICLRCGMNMIVLSRRDIRLLETCYTFRSRLTWVRVVRDTRGRWKIVGSNGNTMAITRKGGLGYLLMSAHRAAPPRLRVV